MVLSAIGQLSRKRLVGLVYVAISIISVGLATQLTEAQVQWFASVAALEPNVEWVTFSVNSSSPLSFILVSASVKNPSKFDGLRVSSVELTVFVSSTTEDFSAQGSSEVGVSGALYKTAIPSQGTFFLTQNLPVLSDLVYQLQVFLDNHHTDLIIYVKFSIDLISSFGPLTSQYCLKMPSSTVVGICPSPRVSSFRGGGGGA